MVEQVRKLSEEKYIASIEKFGLTPMGLDWKDITAQQRRFEQLAKLLDTNNDFSINDLGAGFGDLSLFLRERYGSNFCYHGYDIVPYMVEMANSKFPNEKFEVIETPNQMEIADYTVASGIFNFKASLSEEDWWIYLTSSIGQMFEKSLKGIAFNALTSYSDLALQKSELYYADPCRIFDFCKKNLSRNVALLHDYDFFDFTIMVRK